MFSAFLFAAALVFSPGDADVAYKIADEFVTRCTPRDAGTIRGKIAANFLLDEASKTGADVRRDVFSVQTPKGVRQLTNLYSEFCHNPTSSWVVIVSHYDTKAGVPCPGANDGASSSALLIALAGTLSNWATPKGNVLLVWTDGGECMEQYGENDGLWGSKRAAEYVKDKGIPVRAVICIDMVGDEDLHLSIPANGSPALAKIVQHAARRAGYPDLISLIPDQVKDDHAPFVAAEFQAIDLIDFEYGPGNSYWHTAQDTMEHVSKESLLKTGKVLAELLNILL